MTQALPLEIFLSSQGICMAAPRGCGLDQAQRLEVDVNKRTVIAVKDGSVLPLDLPFLSSAHCQALAAAGNVAIGEFNVRGVSAAYHLPVVVI